MKGNVQIMISRTSIITVILGLFLIGCSQKATQMEALLDSPEHHVVSGFIFIKKNMLNDAQREFEHALQYDPRFSAALRGIGLVYGLKKRFKPAFDSMAVAVLYAKTEQEKALAYVGYIRLHRMRGEKGWLGEAEKNFTLATSLVNDLPEAYYYLGIAYKAGYRYAEAKSAFKKVLEINKNLVTEAEEQLRDIQEL